MNNVVLVNVTFAEGGPALLFRVVPKTDRGYEKLVLIGKMGVSTSADKTLLLDISTGSEVKSPVDLAGYTHFINIDWY